MAVTRTTDKPLVNCSSATGWTVLNADVTTLATSTNCVHGSTALSFAKTNGAANSTDAGIYNDNVSFSLMETSPGDEVVWYLYVSATTNVSNSYVRLGTDATNYMQYTFPVADITAARYTRCHIPLHAGTLTGAVDWSAITYIAVGCTMDAEASALAGILVDFVSHCSGAAGGAGGSGGGGSSIIAADVAKVATSAPTLVTGATEPLSLTTAAELRARIDRAQTTIGGNAAADIVQIGTATTTAAPTYTTAKQNPLSTTTAGELRARLDLAQAATGASVPAQAVQGGLRAETAIPTAVTNGQLVAPAGTTIGRQKLASYDDSTNSERTTPLSEPPRTITSPETFTALSAAGSTAARDASLYRSGTWTMVVASLEAGQFCVVRAEERHDGTNWVNMDAENEDVTITANGNYSLSWSERRVNNVRFRMVTDSVGGAVTVTPTLAMGS